MKAILRTAFVIPCLTLTYLVSTGLGQICTPSGLIGWWRGNGDAMDSIGANNGILVNGAGFAPGVVEQAFVFTNLSQAVHIPQSPTLNLTNGLTLEAWVLVSSYGADPGIIIVGKNVIHVTFEYELGITVFSSGLRFRATVGVPSGWAILYAEVPVETNTWYHVAMTYDNAALRLYVNGEPEGSLNATGPIVTTTAPLIFGGYGSGPWTLQGRVDEVSLYDRALAPEEIQSIFVRGSEGKCGRPIIFSQPKGAIGYWGGNVNLHVGVDGTAPFSYQWYKEAFPISWGTNATLTLTNLDFSDAGNYWVAITNDFGMTNSVEAALLVNPAGVSLGMHPFLSITGAVGKQFGIQYTTDVNPNSSWTTLTNITLTAPVQEWIDTSIDAVSSPKRFYRVIPLP